MRHLLSGPVCATTIVLLASSASAHIELVEPIPRYALPANKACPCGEGDGNRTCDSTAAMSADPNRSTNVSTFEAGSTITVIAEEYIDHSGRMRVAFDPNGADLADFNQNILHDEPDPSDSGLSQANPRVWEFEITLPSTPCDNCTLQVIQVMEGGTANPVLDPAPLSTYYSCADITLVAPGTLGEGGSSSSGGSSADSAPASAGAAPAAETGAVAGGSPAAGLAGAAGAAASNGAMDVDGDGGCALQPLQLNGSSWSWLLSALGLLGMGKLRRRHRGRLAPR